MFLMLFPDSLGSMEIGSNASMFEVFLYNIESYTKFVFFFLTGRVLMTLANRRAIIPMLVQIFQRRGCDKRCLRVLETIFLTVWLCR